MIRYDTSLCMIFYMFAFAIQKYASVKRFPNTPNRAVENNFFILDTSICKLEQMLKAMCSGTIMESA